MANVRTGNTFYIDTQYSSGTDELKQPGIRVTYITFSPTAANGNIVLADSNGNKKIDLRGSTTDTKHFDFSRKPVLFPTGIRPLTVSNAVCSLTLEDPRG